MLFTSSVLGDGFPIYCPKKNEGELDCPSCAQCYSHKASDDYISLTVQSYDELTDTTFIEFIVAVPPDCSYDSISIKLKSSITEELPLLPVITGEGYGGVPDIVEGCNADTGLLKSLVWSLQKKEMDIFRTFTLPLNLTGRWAMSDLFTPASELKVFNAYDDVITPLNGISDDNTFVVAVRFEQGTSCERAPFCYYSTFEGQALSGNVDNPEINASITGTSLEEAVSDRTIMYSQSPEPQPESPENIYYKQTEPQAIDTIFIHTRPINPDAFTCPQLFKVWEPQCYDVARGCEQCWSSSTLVNGGGTTFDVIRSYDTSTDTTTFTFAVEWGPVSCSLTAGSGLPQDVFCQMKKLVIPLVHGVKALKAGYPPVPSGTKVSDVVKQTVGCDESSLTGMKNVVTWDFSKVLSESWESIKTEGGSFASLVFNGRTDFEDTFALVYNGAFQASDTGYPPNQVSSAPGSVAIYAENDSGHCAHGYHQYDPAATYPIVMTIPGNFDSGAYVAEPHIDEGGMDAPTTTSTTDTSADTSSNTNANGQGGDSSWSSGKTYDDVSMMSIPALGDRGFTVNAEKGTVTVMGVGEFSIVGEPGQQGYIEIPGVGRVAVPGYIVSIPMGDTVSLVNMVRDALLKLKSSIDPSGSALIDWTSTSPSICTYRGILCDAAGGEMTIAHVNLSGLGLRGSLPDDAGVWTALDSLMTLDLSNNELNGGIPANLSLLRSAHLIDLSSNRFTGRVPVDLMSLSPVLTLHIDNNAALCGGIPRALYTAITVSTENTGIASPCIVDRQDIKVAMNGETVPLPLGNLISVSLPDPVLVDTFDWSMATVKVLTAPMSGSIEIDNRQVDTFTVADIIAGRVQLRNVGVGDFVVEIAGPTMAASTVTYVVQP